MATRGRLMLQTLLVALFALAWCAYAEEEGTAMEEGSGAVDFPDQQASTFVRRRLAERRQATQEWQWGRGTGWPVGRTMSCRSNPSVCSTNRYSAGPNCCGNFCTDKRYDAYNCGYCGKRCKPYSICCYGKCVSPLSDKYNCGKCGRKCRGKNQCRWGSCGYGSGY